MKKRIHFIVIGILLFVFIIVSTRFVSKTETNRAITLQDVWDIESLCRMQSDQYSFMWWLYSGKENKPFKFAVKTNRYAFIFDHDKLNFQNLIIEEDKRTADEVLKLTADELFIDTDIPPTLAFGLEKNGVFHPCTQPSSRRHGSFPEDCQLVHTGRFLQQRFICNLPELENYEPFQSGLDIVSWPDRLSLLLRLSLTGDSPRDGSNAFIIRFTVPETYLPGTDAGGFKVFRHSSTNKGFALASAGNGATLSVTGNTVEARLLPGNPYLNEYTVGLIIYPLQDVNASLTGITAQESDRVTVTARQSLPVNSTLGVDYKPDMGWYEIKLQNDFVGIAEQDDKRMESVFFTVENNSSSEQTIRLNFDKDRDTYQQTKASNNGISGISAVIRDKNQYPTGIAVQLSKNWHTKDFYNYEGHLYRGNWYHGITTLSIPANSKIELEYTGVNALWGTKPAASHAQLCLVGWGSNQQWNESAIGAWGESISYEPDLVQANSPACDCRTLMVRDADGNKTLFTGNVGGADFFNLCKTNGQRAWHSAVKTYYKRYCPNYTEVINAGELLEGKIQYSYSLSIGRSDDYVRGIYKLRMDVKQAVEFNRFDIFQLASEGYHLSKSKQLAIGDESGFLMKRNLLNSENVNAYIGKKEVLAGRLPWISFFDTPYLDEEGSEWGTRWTSADRGMVIRKWNAVVNGQSDVRPHWQEYNVSSGYIKPASIINLTLPEGCRSLSVGDYIEADIEWFFMPITATQYWGPNENLTKALQQDGGTWKMTYREVTGNNIGVTASKGTVERHYPIVVEVENDEAQFTVTGGLGYVPLTIKGLSSYYKPELYIKKNGNWEKVDQSVYGNDFWQTDYYQNTGKWECTYNVNLDSEQGTGQTVSREFKFLLKKDSSASINKIDKAETALLIYPNPVNDKFRINFQQEVSEGLFKVDIFDNSGKKVIMKSIGFSDNVDISELAKGKYIICVSGKNFNKSGKIIKK